eukprot:6075590-Pleurochrysis_carterae.AAC.1
MRSRNRVQSCGYSPTIGYGSTTNRGEPRLQDRLNRHHRTDGMDGQGQTTCRCVVRTQPRSPAQCGS